MTSEASRSATLLDLCTADVTVDQLQAGPPGRARLAGELREMDQDVLKLTRSLAVSMLIDHRAGLESDQGTGLTGPFGVYMALVIRMRSFSCIRVSFLAYLMCPNEHPERRQTCEVESVPPRCSALPCLALFPVQ